MGSAFRPGERLDPAALAPSLAASVTPVRDALHILTGEGLVETWPGGGFHMPALDEPALCDMYDWSAELLMLAVRNSRHAAGATGVSGPDGGSAAGRVSDLFMLIARRSPNSEHARAVESLNARMNAVRLAEPKVLAGTEEELSILADAVLRDERDRLRRLIPAYHRRRHSAAAAIVRALYRGG